MYFGNRKHILSKALLWAALINILTFALSSLTRLVLRNSSSILPDMSDDYIWLSQLVFSFLRLIAMVAVFALAWKKLEKYMGVVAEDDKAEMGRLQEEVFGGKISSLSADAISRLLQIWAVILVGTQFVYDITSLQYRKFVNELTLLLAGGDTLTGSSFISLYNSTHGFKYLGMLIAILLGVMMTGIFLNDRFLKIVTASVTGAFLLSFAVFQMETFEIFGRSIGVVWTSVIFHVTETVGIIAFSIYLRKKYRGL